METDTPKLADRLLSPLRLATGFAFTAALSSVFCCAGIALLPSRPLRIKLCNVYGKIEGRVIQFIGGIKPVVSHPERVGAAFPAIYVSNHSSVMDIFVALWICPVGGCSVAKKEVGNIPFFGWLYRLSGHLLIDRGDREGTIAALAKTAEVVREHKLGIWIWPEGTRSQDGRLLPFKKGFAHLALATGLPIVPIVFHDLHKSWPKHSYTLRPMTLNIDVLEPIRTEGWTLETIDQHVAEVHKAFADALGPDQKPLAEAPVARAARPAPQGGERGMHAV